MWKYSPPGGHGAVEFLAILRNPLECDPSGLWGVVYRFSVPPLHHPPSFVWERGIPGKKYLNPFSCRCCHRDGKHMQ